MRAQIADCRLQIGAQIGAQTGAQTSVHIGGPVSARIVVMAALALGALTAVVPAARADEVLDRVLAVVGGEMITLTDVTAAQDFGLVAAAGAADPVRAVLSRLIDRELILAEVERYAPPEPGADAVDRGVRAVRARFATAQAFEAALARSGLDEKHLRETLRQDLRIDAYLDQRFVMPAMTDEELSRYYREHAQMFASGATVPPFETVRSRVVQAATADRRAALVGDWVAGLRRRGDVIDLYLARP
jgi:parvulin-like peptidyl-prolyl isomerase